ncbi:MAG: hypothetical protein ACR2PA_04800 [Hyphomicrobiaceae bacterium]
MLSISAKQAAATFDAIVDVCSAPEPSCMTHGGYLAVHMVQHPALLHTPFCNTIGQFETVGGQWAGQSRWLFGY